MESYYQWPLNNRTQSTSNNMAGHNGNCNNNNNAWDQLGSSSNTLLINSTSCMTKPDPHLTCLKLGMTRKGTSGSNYKSPTTDGAPRCQVEGCEAELVNAKDYHRRHKVCEMHAKSPKAVVLGTEQRFCQQCCKFHGVTEFDESKRSCRRRLAGHNERRRKSSQSQQHPLTRKTSKEMKVMAASRDSNFPVGSSSKEYCALSLLSSTNICNYPMANIPTTSYDLPTSCGAALRELIAENRACMQQHFNSNYQECQLTLELMQSPTTTSAFGLLSEHKTPEEGEQQECSEMWKLPLGY